MPKFGGVPGGCLFDPPRGAPGAPPPGGGKSAHFFGYLITLPVGTVWATFSGPPWDGHPRGMAGLVGGVSVYVAIWGLWYPALGAANLAELVGALGRGASDGYPLAGLTANGWYVRPGRAPPSKQGRKSAQVREVLRRRRPFARAKRGPTTGGTGKDRKCLAEHIRPCALCPERSD